MKSGPFYEKRIIRWSAAGLRARWPRRRRYDSHHLAQRTDSERSRTRKPAALSFDEAQRLSGSCPMIFTWNGQHFEFITDVLGVAPLGASSGDGNYFPVDHDEYIQIPGARSAGRNGQLPNPHHRRTARSLLSRSDPAHRGRSPVRHRTSTPTTNSNRRLILSSASSAGPGKIHPLHAVDNGIADATARLADA